ncbi:hypothetical protein G6F59_016737 [Rhizopus arrhizus]|nr:hypothetical protein G6F59_016737 [Rhizopus arrhizus]
MNNQSRVSDAVLQRAFSPLRQCDTVHLDTLDNRLMLVNDMPGIQVQGTLRPGKTPGSPDLFVDAEPGPLPAGSLDVDNFGGYYTGEFRMAGTLDVNSPLRLGDQVNLRTGRPTPDTIGRKRLQHALSLRPRLRPAGCARQGLHRLPVRAKTAFAHPPSLTAGPNPV